MLYLRVYFLVIALPAINLVWNLGLKYYKQFNKKISSGPGFEPEFPALCTGVLPPMPPRQVTGQVRTFLLFDSLQPLDQH